MNIHGLLIIKYIVISSLAIRVHALIDNSSTGLNLPPISASVQHESIRVGCVSPLANHTCFSRHQMSVLEGALHSEVQWTSLNRSPMMAGRCTSRGTGSRQGGTHVPCSDGREARAGAGAGVGTNVSNAHVWSRGGCTLRSNASLCQWTHGSFLHETHAELWKIWEVAETYEWYYDILF